MSAQNTIFETTMIPKIFEYNYSDEDKICGIRELQMYNYCAFHALNHTLGICILPKSIYQIFIEYEKHLNTRIVQEHNEAVADNEIYIWEIAKSNASNGFSASRPFMYWLLTKLLPPDRYILLAPTKERNMYIEVSSPVNPAELRGITHLCNACVIIEPWHTFAAKKIHDDTWCIMDSEDSGSKLNYFHELVEEYKKGKGKGSFNLTQKHFVMFVELGLKKGDSFVFIIDDSFSTEVFRRRMIQERYKELENMRKELKKKRTHGKRSIRQRNKSNGKKMKRKYR